MLLVGPFENYYNEKINPPKAYNPIIVDEEALHKWVMGKIGTIVEINGEGLDKGDAAFKIQ